MKITSKGHEVELTDEEFVDICEMGISTTRYWCSLIERDDPIGVWYFTEHEAGKRCLVNKASAERVMAAMLDGNIKIADYIVDYIRKDDIDGEAADAIIQLVCFDEVVYG